MSYTNKTPNYNLPQYVADDKPTYLGDFNKAMLDIDTNMKAIDNKATSSVATANTANATATEALETATDAQANVSNAQTLATEAKQLATTANTTANTANTNASTANTKAENALSTANTASSNANQAKTNAQTALNTANNAQASANDAQATADSALEMFKKFNFTDIKKNQSTADVGYENTTIVGNPNITVATNADKSIFKVYGNITLSPSASKTVSFFVNTSLRPASAINFDAMGLVCHSTSSQPSHAVCNATLGTDGKLTFRFYSAYNVQVEVYIPPCIYFVQDFGDTASVSE